MNFMFGAKNKKKIKQLEEELRDARGQVKAIGRSQAVIEFNMDGTIITANENFLNAVGYTLEEIQGKHHSMFVEPGLANSDDYKQFWESLGRGEYQAREFKRIGKNGKKIWIQATYNPILGGSGTPFKVVKYATDVTQRKLEAANNARQLEAIDKSQAVIEFNMDGTIITANDNFLSTVGYSLKEIQGNHHSMFVSREESESRSYKEFWQELNEGKFKADKFKRIHKNGNDVWIRATYNPILDLDGNPYKVVKFAADVTEQTELQNVVQDLLNDLGRVMLALAEGRLNERITTEFTGEFAVLKSAVNDYCEKIARIAFSIGESSQQVSTGAEEISKGNINLSRRTEAQAASLVETSASMEQMTSTVKQNADNAKDANDLAVSARDQASTGGEVVSKAITAMDEINQASNKISDIIGVIDEIAFQTNLLALNAAVEAARAGEQGRGFAVVATEVRNLAGRSATAAKEIKSLIEDSVEKVTEGSRLVNQSGETLNEIMGSVRQVAEIVGDISSATQEQALGIGQVNKAIIDMDHATQENTAMVEEAASAAKSMSHQSDELNSLISFFKVETASEPASDAAIFDVDRRSQDRPWSENAESQKNDQANDFNVAVGSDVTDNWEEF